jgi:hypothetical protein
LPVGNQKIIKGAIKSKLTLAEIKPLTKNLYWQNAGKAISVVVNLTYEA